MKTRELLLATAAMAEALNTTHNFDSLGTPRGGIPNFRGMKIGGGKKRTNKIHRSRMLRRKHARA